MKHFCGTVTNANEIHYPQTVQIQEMYLPCLDITVVDLETESVTTLFLETSGTQTNVCLYFIPK